MTYVQQMARQSEMQRSIIDSNMEIFANELDNSAVLPSLISARLINDKETSTILSMQSRVKANIYVMTKLKERLDVFDKFHDILVKNGQAHLADILKPGLTIYTEIPLSPYNVIMSDELRKSLDRNLPTIAKMDLSKILIILISKGLFTDSQVQLMLRENNLDNIMSFTSQLKTRGKNGYIHFYNALIETGQGDIATVLKPYIS